MLSSTLSRLNRRRSHQSGSSITRFHWSRVALMRSARPRRRTLLAPEGYGKFAATGWPRCVDAFLVFLQLLEGEAECGTQLFLAHCKRNAAHPHPAADVLVGGFRGLLSRQL